MRNPLSNTVEQRATKQEPGSGVRMMRDRSLFPLWDEGCGFSVSETTTALQT
jgi:ribosomal protein L27